MPGVRAETLLSMTYWINRFTLGRAWNNLTDAELFWEPVPGESWGIRRRSECTTSDPFRSTDEDWVADYDNAAAMKADWITVVEPPTTIGWQFWHVGSMPGRLADLDFFGGTHTAKEGWTSPYLTTHPIFPTAADAVDSMRDGWRRLVGCLREATDEDLTRPTEWWSFGDQRPPTTGAEITAQILNEISHHGTHIGVLRDFYVAAGRPGAA